MKQSHGHWHLGAFISILKFPAIRTDEDQAFDVMSEESERNKIHEHFIAKKQLQPAPSQGIVEQAKQNGELRPQQAERGLTQEG